MGINMLPNCLHPNVDSPYQTAQLCIMLVGRIKQYNHKPGEVITSTSFQHSQFSRVVDWRYWEEDFDLFWHIRLK